MEFMRTIYILHTKYYFIFNHVSQNERFFISIFIQHSAKQTIRHSKGNTKLVLLINRLSLGKLLTFEDLYISSGNILFTLQIYIILWVRYILYIVWIIYIAVKYTYVYVHTMRNLAVLQSYYLHFKINLLTFFL